MSAVPTNLRKTLQNFSRALYCVFFRHKHNLATLLGYKNIFSVFSITLHTPLTATQTQNEF